MNRLLLLSLLLLLSGLSHAQEYTWAEDIAPLIYTRCSHCHHEGAIAPFTLMSYEEVVSVSHAIKHSFEENKMPPWPADPNYRHFADEFYLTEQEKQMVYDWIDAEHPPGDMSLAPFPPTFPEGGTLLDTIDYVLQIDPYTLPTDVDEYRYFAIENPSEDTIYVHRIEVIPGLPDIVHHADLFFDVTGTNMELDLATPEPGFSAYPTSSYYMNAWQPGANIVEYPEGWGIVVPPHADFGFEIHYGPGGIGRTDSTKMNIQILRNVEQPRQVEVSWHLNQNPGNLIDGPLFIPANEIVTFHQIGPPLPYDMSVISICPHMHFLGKSYKVWAITPENDSIPMIDIPHWDFHWQRYYVYPNPQHLPAGTRLYSEGVYDNTSYNHDNPNIPPIDVGAGANTTDEMFLCFLIYSEYQQGDEELVMGNPIELEVPAVGVQELEFSSATVAPNPGKGHWQLNWKESLQSGKLTVWSSEGQIVLEREGIIGRSYDLRFPELFEGLYYFRLSDGKNSYRGSFVAM